MLITPMNACCCCAGNILQTLNHQLPFMPVTTLLTVLATICIIALFRKELLLSNTTT